MEYRERRERKKKRPPECEFCAYDDTAELKKCHACGKWVCKNPTCRVPHDKQTCT